MLCYFDSKGAMYALQCYGGVSFYYSNTNLWFTFLLPSPRFTRAKDYNYIPGEWNYTTNCLYQNKLTKAPQLVLLSGEGGVQMGELRLGLGLGSIQDTKTGPHLREKRKRTR